MSDEFVVEFPIINIESGDSVAFFPKKVGV